MCATCGCGIPESKHGDKANITVSDLKAAAKTRVGPGTVGKALRNASKTVKRRK